MKVGGTPGQAQRRSVWWCGGVVGGLPSDVHNVISRCYLGSAYACGSPRRALQATRIVTALDWLIGTVLWLRQSPEPRTYLLLELGVCPCRIITLPCQAIIILRHVSNRLPT